MKALKQYVHNRHARRRIQNLKFQLSTRRLRDLRDKICMCHWLGLIIIPLAAKAHIFSTAKIQRNGSSSRQRHKIRPTYSEKFCQRQNCHLTHPVVVKRAQFSLRTTSNVHESRQRIADELLEKTFKVMHLLLWRFDLNISIQKPIYASWKDKSMRDIIGSSTSKYKLFIHCNCLS